MILPLRFRGETGVSPLLVTRLKLAPLFWLFHFTTLEAKDAGAWW